MMVVSQEWGAVAGLCLFAPPIIEIRNLILGVTNGRAVE
jgi:hypothetical protein